jgi:outer membrane cobalamin receptor
MTKSLITVFFFNFLLFEFFFVSSQTISIKGKVVTDEKQPASFAAVSALTMPDSILIKGITTDINGLFTIEGLHEGNIIIKIQSLGFKDFFSSEISLSKSESEKRLGIFILQPDIKKIKEVEVNAERPFVQQQADKRVYNVEKSITTSGGTAADVLQNIPSVSQDADGNISIRGSEGVNILINGKPTTLAGGDKTQLLQQIPANTIISVEVITNPSSKYDAEGSSGIINIITKRSEKENISGNVGASYTIYNKAGMNASINYKNKHYSIGGSYALNYNPRFNEGKTYRKNTFADTTFSSEQINNGDRIQLNNNLRLNGEYYFNNKNTMGANFSFNKENSDNPETTRFLNYDFSDVLADERFRDIESNRKSWNYNAGLNYRRTFKKPGNELTADANYSYNISNESSQFEDRYKMLNYVSNNYYYRFSQKNINNGITANYIFQTDYTHSIKKQSKIETGLKASFRDISGDYSLTNLDTTSGNYIPDSLNGSMTFKYSEQVYASYLNFSNKFKKLSYQIGLRAEQTFIDGNGQSVTTENARVKRNYFNFFPTGFLAYNFKNEHQMQLSYSMRISRPWHRQLMPFVEVSDPYNLRVGNPKLNPELFHSVELGWNKMFKKHFASASVYYRQSNNNIGRIRTVDAEGISTITYENLNKQYSYGIEIILRNNWTKWWDMTTSFNGYQSFVNGNNISPDLSNSGFGYTLKHNMNFKFWKNAVFQSSYNFNGPRPFAQGNMLSFWSLDLALKKEFLKNKATVTINAQDIFFTRKFGFTQEQPAFTQDFWRRRESRVVVISFNYRFGTNETSQRKKGRPSQGQQPEGGDMIDF